MKKRTGSRLILFGDGHELKAVSVENKSISLNTRRLISLKPCSATSRSAPSHFRRARTIRLQFKVSARHVQLHPRVSTFQEAPVSVRKYLSVNGRIEHIFPFCGLQAGNIMTEFQRKKPTP